MAGKRVLSVGQCQFDHGGITSRLGEVFGAVVVPADHAAQALAQLDHERFDLVLVNRIFDADGGSGIDLIRCLNSPGRPPRMLVSNLAEAQDQAVAAGAVRGFGKAELREPSLVETLKPFLG